MLIKSDQSFSSPAEIAEELNFTMVCNLCLGQLSLEVQAKRRGTCRKYYHDKVKKFFFKNVLTPTKLCCRYHPQQQLVAKSGGIFFAVRERLKVHKLGLCLHQYNCRFGEDCKFAHGQAELQLWKGVTQCMCRHFCMIGYICACMYVHTIVCVGARGCTF